MKKFVIICACALFAGSIPAGAAETTQIVIDRHPNVVRFRATPLIAGHTDAPSSAQVKLQKRLRSQDAWNVIDKRRVGASPAVKFRLGETKHTADYRFVVDGRPSNTIRIRVRPRLRIDARPADVLKDRKVVLVGRTRPLVKGRVASVLWRVDGRWRKVSDVKVGDGRFRIETQANAYGRRPVRVVFDGDKLNSYRKDRARLRVHRREMATWYGPGFYGNRTACGQRYHRDLLGVAHRTLRCGTKVSVLFHGRKVRVPVVDRGPYGHANWDLTRETARRLGFAGREQVGVLH